MSFLPDVYEFSFSDAAPFILAWVVSTALGVAFYVRFVLRIVYWFNIVSKYEPENESIKLTYDVTAYVNGVFLHHARDSHTIPISEIQKPLRRRSPRRPNNPHHQ